MPSLKDISPVKKAFIGLSFVGIGAAAGVASSDNTSNFQRFLNQSENISVSAFDRKQVKQVELTNMQSLANFLESGPVKPGSFSAAPQPYAKWAANRLTGEQIVRADLSSSSWQADIRESLAKDMATITAQSGSIDLSHKDLLENYQHSVSQQLDSSEIIAGYSISKNSQGGVELHIASVADSQNVNPLDKKIEIKEKIDNFLGSSAQEPGFDVVKSTYQSKEIETMSALGEKGTLNYLELNETLSSLAETERYSQAVKQPEVLAMMTLERKGITLDQAAPKGELDQNFVNALNSFSKNRSGSLAQQEITNGDALVQKMSLVGNETEEKTLADELRADPEWLMGDVIRTEAHPSIQALRSTIDQPCSPGVAHVLNKNIEDPALAKAQMCAEQYGYSLPEYWMESRSSSDREVSKLRAPSTLLGFDKGVAVFAYSEADRGLGFSFSGIVSNPEKEGVKIRKSDYDQTFVVVNPFHPNIEHLSPKMHAATMEFITKHEVAHSLSVVPDHGKEVDLTASLRNVSDETDCDMYAAQEMLREGHSPEFVVEVHEKFLKSLTGSKDFREHKVDEAFIKDIRQKSWVGNTFMDTERVRSAIETGTGSKEVLENLTTNRSQEMIDMVNSLEFAARHSEVKRAVESFQQGNPIDVFGIKDLEPRRPSAPSPSSH